MKLRKIKAADAFCGCGGATTGFELKADQFGLDHVSIAVNHWDIAIDTMSANHPKVQAVRADMMTLLPSEVLCGQLDFFWASPSCTHHSRAKGGRPRENQLRSQPELLYPWIDYGRPKFIVIENVPEFVEWGPLNAKNMPIKKMKGKFFIHFIEGIKLRGYDVDWRVVCCADYGDATTRKRLFIKAVRHGCGKIEWPNPTHAENPETDLFGTKLKKWRAIRECLDFDDIGRSVFNRPKPLAEKTMRRIADGMRKYCGVDLQPFLVKMYGTGKSNSIDKPISTITAGGEHYALCRPFLVKSNNNQTVESVDGPVSTIVAGTVHHALCTPFVITHQTNNAPRSIDKPIRAQTCVPKDYICTPFVVDHTNNGKARSVDKPIPAQTTKDHVSLITPMVLGQQGGAECRPVDKPVPTIATSGAIRLITPFVVDNANGGIIRGADEPMNTVTVKDQHMGVFPMLEDGRIIDIYIRMLKPKELAAAHSFPADYVLTGNRGQQIKQIGNSVPVLTAAAMCESALRQLAFGRVA